MYVAVIHTINNPDQWAERIEAFEEAQLPEGVTNPISYIGEETELAFCLYECEDLDELQVWLDDFMGAASTQRYFEVDPAAPGTYGIPAHMTAG